MIDWMSGLPAPTAVIGIMSCMYKMACNDDSCDCIRNGLKCSDLCHLTTCSNQPDEHAGGHPVQPILVGGATFSEEIPDWIEKEESCLFDLPVSEAINPGIETGV